MGSYGVCDRYSGMRHDRPQVALPSHMASAAFHTRTTVTLGGFDSIASDINDLASFEDPDVEMSDAADAEFSSAHDYAEESLLLSNQPQFYHAQNIASNSIQKQRKRCRSQCEAELVLEAAVHAAAMQPGAPIVPLQQYQNPLGSEHSMDLDSQRSKKKLKMSHNGAA